MKIHSIIALFFVIFSFQMKGQDGYVRYQTFDEYKMEGVGAEKIKRPYVLVKKENDTIFVKKIVKKKGKNRCNCTVKEIKYINKGDYWHTTIRPESKRTLIARPRPCIPIFYEKFIFNDTIVEYQYSLKYGLKEVRRVAQYIHIHTKKDCVILSLQDNDIKNYGNPYNEVKEFVINYKEIFPLYSSGYQPRYYTIFEKQIEGNIFSIYIIDGENKRFFSSKEMNSLGEYDNKGRLAWWW